MGSRWFCLKAALLLLILPTSAFALAVPEPVQEIPVAQVDANPLSVTLDKQQVEAIRTKPVAKVLTLEDLDRKRLQRLQDVARELKGQGETIADFDAYLKWMGGALASYGKYVEAGSFAAGFAKYLPVPYAGQAGQLTKFISHFALSLSATSAAVTSYLKSSQHFIASVEKIGANPDGRENELAMLTFYADQQLSRDMLELQGRLVTVSDLSGSALSFLLGLQQYLGNTDEYWQKTKSFVSRKEIDKAEKGALAGSIDGLRARAETFNAKLKQYDVSVSGTLPRIASLVAYDELRQDIEAKTAGIAPAETIRNN